MKRLNFLYISGLYTKFENELSRMQCGKLFPTAKNYSQSLIKFDQNGGKNE